MLKRKVDNCDNNGWVTINHKSGQYPMQVHLTLKTGMFELLQNNFLAYMKGFNIFPQNMQNPENCVKITQNENGIERYEYDLSMEINGSSVGLKVKLYSTKSSLDVQGLKSFFSKEIEALGNRTIAVYFVEVVIEAIFQCMMNECNLEQYNQYCKEQLNLGLASSSKQKINKNETKAKKSKKQTLNDSKCNICDSNTKELNSFKCPDCSHMFHKLCVNKRTSPAEFALIKSGDVVFNCDDCIGKRRGFNTTSFNSFNLVEAIREIVNECVEIEDIDNTPKQLSIEDHMKSSDVNIVNNLTVNTQEEALKENNAGHEENEITEESVEIIDETEPSSNPMSSKGECANCVSLCQDVSLLLEQKEHSRIEHDECKLEMKKWKKEAEEKEKKNIEILNKLDKMIKENEDLKKEVEQRKEEEKIDEEKWQRANLDFDRIKLLHEKVSKENVKIAETCKNEIKVILKQKLEAENRYNDLVNEREKYREKERILLNTFDLLKSKFDLQPNSKKVEGSTHIPDSSYDCSKCVYEATTIADLRKHELDIHIQQEFKCQHCGHTVLSESDLRGHIEAYHENIDAGNNSTIFICTSCDEEYQRKEDLEQHMRIQHSQEESDFKCDKCDYEGESTSDLEKHRQADHYQFKYFCCACDYETLNKNVLKLHKTEKHQNAFLETRREKVFPPPKCNLMDPSHSTKCCDRTRGAKRPRIYSNEERKSNGICINWNKGNCDFFELCKFSHDQLEECKFAYFCSRQNCKYWHNILGKFPFLAKDNHQKIRKW